MRFFVCFILIIVSHCSFGDSVLTNSEFSETAFDIDNSVVENEWLLALEFGGTLTTGNTETETILGKINGGLDYLNGRLTYFAQFYQKTDDEVRSVDNWKIGLKHNIFFTEDSSSFVILDHENDKFANTQVASKLAAGYTQRLFDNKILLWDADVGPGVVKSQYDNDKDILRILHLGSQFKLSLNNKTEFKQVLVADLDVGAENNDVYRSETSLSASIVDNLKMKITYAMKYDEVVEIGNDELDTEASMSLVYIF